MHINSRAIKPPDKENGIAWGQDGVTTSISKSFKWNEQSKGILCGRIFATNKLDSEDGNYYSDQLNWLNVFFVQTKTIATNQPRIANGYNFPLGKTDFHLQILH